MKAPRIIKFIFRTFLAIALVTSIFAYVQFRLAPQTYTVGVLAEIDENSTYNALYIQFILAFADSNDMVIIRVDTPGGLVSQAEDIIHAMNTSDATTISINAGRAASGGALIAVSADIMIAEAGTYYMFHRPYYKSKGIYKMSSITSRGYQFTDTVMQTKAFKYMTEGEREDYILGKDVYILGIDLEGRAAQSKPGYN